MQSINLELQLQRRKFGMGIDTLQIRMVNQTAYICIKPLADGLQTIDMTRLFPSPIIPLGPGQVDTNFDTMSIDMVSTFFMKSLDLQQFFDII